MLEVRLERRVHRGQVMSCLAFILSEAGILEESKQATVGAHCGEIAHLVAAQRIQK